MRIIYSKKIGFCSGVKRAISMVESLLKSDQRKAGRKIPYGSIYSLGPLIHNPQEVARLRELGLKVTSDLGDVRSGTLVIPSHGAPKWVHEKAREKKIRLLDTTCPFVRRAQRVAEMLHKRGYQVIIIGDKSHPEVLSLASFCQGKGVVVKGCKDLEKVNFHRKIGIVSQTTQLQDIFERVVTKVKKKAKSQRIEVHNTICRETFQRQEEARELAKKADLAIVVGGRNSANTKRLYDTVKKITCSHHIESEKELKPAWVKGRKVIAITTGTSTPEWIIRNVEKGLRTLSAGVRNGK